MSRNYKTIEKLAITRDELSDWADCRNTHMAVALAIHAIADDRRNPQQIWEDPTRAEWDHVTMAVEEYVTQGDFDVLRPHFLFDHVQCLKRNLLGLLDVGSRGRVQAQLKLATELDQKRMPDPAFSWFQKAARKEPRTGA